MRYRDHEGRIRQKSTGERNQAEAEKALRKAVYERDQGLLPAVELGSRCSFAEWAEWYLENRSQPPFRAEKTHRENLNALKFLLPRFGQLELSTITSESIESYLRDRLNSGRRVHTKFGLEHRGRLKPATVHKEFRILKRMLNIAKKKRRLAANPCDGVEFPVRMAGTTRKPHYVTSAEQERIEMCAPSYLRNIVVIMTEMGLRPYKELIPIRKEQIDLVNCLVHLSDSKTTSGIADMPMSPRAREAFESQLRESEGSPYLFPSPTESRLPHLTTVKRAWAATLRRAGVPHFTLYELRHTFATRLSAGGVADHFVTQMLRQGDAAVFKRYSQAKLNMMREALEKLDRRADERGSSSGRR
jgi:integrase